jgi:hypothetical protein
MFVSELDILVRREQYKELLRGAALERLTRAARPWPTGSGGLYPRKSLAGWVLKVRERDHCQAGELGNAR